jgi:hypothetical protein
LKKELPKLAQQEITELTSTKATEILNPWFKIFLQKQLQAQMAPLVTPDQCLQNKWCWFYIKSSRKWKRKEPFPTDFMRLDFPDTKINEDNTKTINL